MNYGTKRDYRKIDIFTGQPGAWRYVASTTWSRTCRDAVAKYKESKSIPADANTVKAQFSKT